MSRNRFFGKDIDSGTKMPFFREVKKGVEINNFCTACKNHTGILADCLQYAAI